MSASGKSSSRRYDYHRGYNYGIGTCSAGMQGIADRDAEPRCVKCGAPGEVHHMPGDRPDFWLCWDCDD